QEAADRTLWVIVWAAAMVTLLAIAGTALAARAILCPPWPGCSASEQALRQGRAAEAIDLNADPVGSLIRLPEIGPKRAQAIVEYRTRPGHRPFRRLEDLENVSGIGEGIVREVARDQAFIRFSSSPQTP
ncbi:MAG: helix-hairpin-helix domain-containing protein, partial [Planctomycetota bacterium]|nr:helix-hairpin-helix domain-containing protein [Planctomycetota bacterium]